MPLLPADEPSSSKSHDPKLSTLDGPSKIKWESAAQLTAPNSPVNMVSFETFKPQGSIGKPLSPYYFKIGVLRRHWSLSEVCTIFGWLKSQTDLKKLFSLKKICCVLCFKIDWIDRCPYITPEALRTKIAIIAQLYTTGIGRPCGTNFTIITISYCSQAPVEQAPEGAFWICEPEIEYTTHTVARALLTSVVFSWS